MNIATQNLLAAPAMGVEMSLALAGMQVVPCNLLPPSLKPVATELFQKSGFDDIARKPTGDYETDKPYILSKLASRFNAALQVTTESAKPASAPEAVVNKFVDERYDAVHFDELVGAGLVTTTAASNYLAAVNEAANVMLEAGRVEDTARDIEKDKMIKKMFYFLSNLSLIAPVVGAALILKETLLHTNSFDSAVVGSAAIMAGEILHITLRDISNRAFGRAEQSRTSIQNATTALVALQRYRGTALLLP